ncbi:MAG: ankyrin repeat domain-containing protein [Candidatus Marsarchaeota archaeon]|nr:ankyrin repeat domain-containing protein [Candidatus Marsarchaeota archaeon]
MAEVIDLKKFKREKLLKETEKWEETEKTKELNGLLFKAINVKDFKSVRDLVKNGADVNAKNELKASPLHLLSEQGETDMVEFLIKNHANINSKDILQWSPLRYAVFNKNLGTAELLMKNGAAMDKEVLNAAKQSGSKELMELIRVYTKH